MNQEDQAGDYVKALLESQALDDLLAALTLRLKTIGHRLIHLGAALEEGKGQQPLDWTARSFSRQSFEEEYAAIPDLLEQYKASHAKRQELEAHLAKFSWHKTKS